MQDTGTAPIALEYATDLETGDTHAAGVLVRLIRWFLWFDIARRLIDLGVVFVYVANNPRAVSWQMAFYLAFELVQVYLLTRCLAALRRRWAGLFYLAFLAMVLEPLATAALNFDPDMAAQGIIQAAASLAYTVVVCSYLLLVPLLRGRESREWLARLTWMAIAILGLSMVPWLRDAATRLFYESQRPMDGAIFYRPTWLEAGVWVSIVALLLLRHEHNRVLIRLTAAWTLVFLLQGSLRYFAATFGLEFDWRRAMFIFAPDLWRIAVAALPFALLVWFTFRFTDAQRRAMGQRVQLAQY